MASKSPQHLTKTSFFSDLIELESKMNNSIPNNEETSDDETLEGVTPCSSSKKKALSRKKILSSQDEKDAIKDSINSKEGILMNSSILNNEETTDDETLEDVTPCSSAKKKALLRKKFLSSQEEKDVVKDSINTKEGILMNSSIPNNEETTNNETLEDVTPCSSAKKKALSRKKVLSSQEEKDSKEGILIDRSKDPIDSEKTACYNSDSEEDDIGDIGIRNTARKNGEEKGGAKKKKATISSIDDEDDFTPQKQIKTEREQNARKRLALEQLVHSRNHTKGTLNMTVDAEKGSPGESQVSSLLGESDLDDFAVDQDSKSKDLFSGSADESSGDESDLGRFVEENSQSQDLTIACPYLYNPTEEEMFEVLIKNLLQSSVDALPEENDYRFDRAQTHWEKLINTKKENQVASSMWKNYKKSLMNCPLVKSKPHQYRPRKGKCQACLFPRSLTEWIVCYQPDGEVIEEFEVGCFCAERGLLYHDLHHWRQKLKESCSEKVRHKAGTKTPEEIVEECLDDQEWLDMLFNNFQSDLNAADRWATDGDKKKAMQMYCRSFDPCY